MPLGHAAGCGNNPRFCAPEQASFGGGAPPLHVGQPLTGQLIQLTYAFHPPLLTV